MQKFNLKEYTKSMKQLLVFDVLIKDEVVNKDIFLESKGIAPTSYRRARVKEQKVGNEIVLILAKHFKLKLINDKYIDHLEKLITKIYLDINYRVTEKHNEYLLELSKLERDKTVVFPLIKLFKIFVIAFSNKNVPDLIKEYEEDFNYLTQYEVFFNEDLIEIFDLLKLTFISNISKEMLAKQYSNGISYSIIAGRYFLNKRFFESLFFAQKAKDIFLHENNYKRCISVNFTILNNFASTGTFNDYYLLAREQLLTVRAFNANSEEEIASRKHLIISALSVNELTEVCELVEQNINVSLTEVFCYIIAKHKLLSDALFDKWFSTYITEIEIKKEFKEHCLLLVDYLRNPEKRKLFVLEECRIMHSLIEVIKWL